MAVQTAPIHFDLNHGLATRTVLRRSRITSAVERDEPGAEVALSGDAALARGLLEGGAKVVASFPGAPACQYPDILAALAGAHDLHVEWSMNEKVAFEVAAAAAVSGVRACYGGKDLGMNVASDTLMQLCYGGIEAGMLMIAATDVGAYVSSGEFDCRYYTSMFGFPGLDPADPQEAKDMAAASFEISERTKLPVLMLVTGEVGWRYSAVRLGALPAPAPRVGRATKDPARWKVHGPMVHRNKAWQKERLAVAREVAETSPFNRLDMDGGERIGVITIGTSSNYVLEAKERYRLTDVAVLKLGFFNPLPEALIRRFLSGMDRVLIVETLEPFVEDKVRELLSFGGRHVEIIGKRTGHLPTESYYTLEMVAAAVRKLGSAVPEPKAPEAPGLRKELLDMVPVTRNGCPGCPHRATFYALKKALQETGKEPFTVVDTGCASFVGTPMGVGDMKLNLGASIGLANGLHAANVTGKEVIAALGDSAFLHGGIPPLLNMAQENVDGVVLIMDNLCNAATGHQPSGSTGVTGDGSATRKADFAALARACGAGSVTEVDPYDLMATKDALVDALRKPDGQRVVVATRECAYAAVTRRRLEQEEPPRFYVKESCTSDKRCVADFGCPAIFLKEDGKASIDPNLCFGCGVCLSVCDNFGWVAE